jgi:16S rRNA (adenine1518-N6/adenine1519-N6)-dimethyltransferase
VFLIQKEVADKIKTDAPKKSYLWWLVNNYYTIDYLFIVKPKSFRPPPKVDSAVITFTRKEKPELDEMSGLITFLDHVSYMKRKTLGAIQKKASKK